MHKSKAKSFASLCAATIFNLPDYRLNHNIEPADDMAILDFKPSIPYK